MEPSTIPPATAPAAPTAPSAPVPPADAGPDDALRPGATYTAPVTDLTAEGSGVLRLGRLVVFVPGALPGDRVEFRLERVRRGHGEGRLLRLVEPAPARRAAPCPHQEACGGCALMPLDPAAALALKARHLGETLRRIGGVAQPVERAVPSPQELGYRGRVRFVVAPRERGPRFGYHPRGRADAMVPIDGCLLAPPRASALARALLERLHALSPVGRPWPEQISLRGSLARGEWLAVLHGPPGPWPEAALAARQVMEAAPDLAGVVRVVERGPRGAAEFVLAGRASVLETIGGVDVELGATTFLQVNPGAAALLYDEVRAALAGPAGTPAPARLLDLYCGAGLNALLAVEPGVAVLGVEIDAGSVDRARRAAARAGRPGAEFVAEDAVRAAERLAAQGERFDRVVLNPPRQGAGPGLARAVAALAPRVVVVVSCHPAALARDVAGLAAAGFAVDRVTAVDMFPQSPHLEAVVRLVPAR